MEKNRCFWASGDDFYIRYHDEEWGVPVHDDRKLFEFLILEGFQAGLSWHCILAKRENFRKAFDGFDPLKVSKYGEKKIESLMLDAGIIRNRLKINAAVFNAKAFLEVQKEFGSFDKYIWGFVNNKPIQNAWKTGKEIPAKTELAEAISKDLKSRGFKFVGPTVVYAHMQATGMVNDHLTSCFRWKECIAKQDMTKPRYDSENKLHISALRGPAMKAGMIAPCGMNCNVCRAVLDKAGKNKKCPGCKPRGQGCIHGKGLCEKLVKSQIDFCYECESFPCARLKRLDRRYRTRYHYCFIEALEFIRDNGMKAHLAREKELWKCPECGGTACIHNGKCYSCHSTIRSIG